MRKRKLVPMDEATSSIDAETAKKIGEIVKAEFGDSTILMVAQRKETILNGEVVIVKEQGEIVEMGNPKSLMKNEGSKLRLLLQGIDDEVGMMSI